MVSIRDQWLKWHVAECIVGRFKPFDANIGANTSYALAA